jgi:hypothetical protein
MAFWSATENNEPRRNFKFLLDVNGIKTWVVKGVNLPTITVGESTHHFLNHRFYFPGTIEYNTISFTVVDAIDEKTSQGIISNFVNSGYNTPGSSDSATTTLMTKAQSVRALGEVTITQLGSGMSTVDKNSIGFALKNAWVKNIEFGQSLDYSNEDLSEIKVELRYDFFNFLDGDNAITGFGGS